MGLRNSTRIKGVHGAEAEEQEKDVIVTENLWHLSLKPDPPQRHHNPANGLLLLLLNIPIKLRLIAREPGLHLSLDYRVIIRADLKTKRVEGGRPDHGRTRPGQLTLTPSFSMIADAAQHSWLVQLNSSSGGHQVQQGEPQCAACSHK